MDVRCINLPMFTRPLLLYSVPRWGPERDRKVCRRGSKYFIWGLAMAARMIMFPKEWPTKLILVGLRPHASTWYKISATNLSVIVSKSEKVSPWNNLFQIQCSTSDLTNIIANQKFEKFVWPKVYVYAEFI